MSTLFEVTRASTLNFNETRPWYSGWASAGVAMFSGGIYPLDIAAGRSKVRG
jgi:hypothetical protein